MLRLRIVDQIDNDNLVIRVTIAPRERALVVVEVRARLCAARHRGVVDADRAGLAASSANDKCDLPAASSTDWLVTVRPTRPANSELSANLAAMKLPWLALQPVATNFPSDCRMRL